MRRERLRRRGRAPRISAVKRRRRRDGREHPIQRLQALVGNQRSRRMVAARMPGSAGRSSSFDDPADHGSPPATGPGSRRQPLIAGRGATQSVASMRTDAFYASPVNPDNPVLAWTDGAKLHFSPARTQIDAGRTLPAPEPTFAPPAGYTASELHWDRRSDRVTGGGSLVVVARKRDEPDLEVAVSNTLEQRSHFRAPGSSGSASLQVTRRNAEFLRSYDTSVPLELSGASAPGAIHGVRFPDGFLRYRAAAGDHDLYVARGADPFAHLVERATGDITASFPSGTIDAVVAEESGVVHLERTTTVFGLGLPLTQRIDLRASPPEVTTSAGHASSEPGYAAARARVESLGVKVEEHGARLRVAELEAVEEALTAGGDRGLDVLVRFQALEGLGATEPILDLQKVVGPDDARGFAAAGAGVPLLHISEPFGAPGPTRASTVRHEMTHVLMGAVDALRRAGRTRRERADLEGALRYESRRGRRRAREGLLRFEEYGAGDPVPAPGSAAAWRGRVGEDPELAAVWVELLRRYRFIHDPEGTGEVRGVSLADESRYSGAAEITSGHPATGVSEFVASFVASATVFRTEFAHAVLAAETAGNARGGRGGSYLRSLYRRAWTRIDAEYVPLGPNPF